MVPNLTLLLDMAGRGEIPMDEVAALVIKSIALRGGKADYDLLPLEIKQAISVKLDWYKSAGGWYLVSSDGMENYGKYADGFLEKLGG